MSNTELIHELVRYLNIHTINIDYNRRLFLDKVQIFVKGSKIQKYVWGTKPNKYPLLSRFFV